jgi:hypothetical protein
MMSTDEVSGRARGPTGDCSRQPRFHRYSAGCRLCLGRNDQPRALGRVDPLYQLVAGCFFIAFGLA